MILAPALPVLSRAPGFALCLIICLAVALIDVVVHGHMNSAAAATAPIKIKPGERRSEDIQIVDGKDRTVIEYRQNGVLMLIKIVPKNGKPYYMVPGDGTPHYKDLTHSDRLHPRWVIFEW